MYTNILKAIINIKNLQKRNLEEIYPPNSEMSRDNRINSVGAGLEFFVKDSLSNSFDEIDKSSIHSETFSWLGNSNNPPDIIINESDAIEVKKMENKSSIALNSSYPKSKLLSSDGRISNKCRICEDNWKIKDIIYAVGIVKNKIIKNLFFIYGDIYAADHEVYDRVFNVVRDSIIKSELSLSVTKELGRINRVDPLGVTYLRVRGMWGIEHPLDVFNYLFKEDSDSEFDIILLMRKEKYHSFPEDDRKLIENDKEFSVDEVKVKDPNNPANLINSILIRYGEL